MGQDLLTVEEVATALRISRRMVYRLIQRGELEALHIGDLYRIPRESLDRFIETARRRAVTTSSEQPSGQS